MVTAAILAGGLAMRFEGRDKSLLVVEGEMLLHRQLAQLSQVSDDILVVGARHPREATAGVRYLGDRAPGHGPLGGLDTALAEARYDPVVVVACDMPYLSAALLAYLAGQVRQSDAVDAAVPRTALGYHPLCAAYRRRCHDVVVEQMAARRLSLMALLERLVVRDVTVTDLATFGDPDRLLTNVNTAAEYDALASHTQ